MESNTKINTNNQTSRINNNLCNICKKNIIEPVRCTACKNLFCKKCSDNSNIENCPICDFYPFKVMKKESYDKFIKAIRLCKVYKYALDVKYNCNCVFCNRRCHEKNFLEHILIEHKDFAIDVFNKKRIYSKKQELLTKMFNQS